MVPGVGIFDVGAFALIPCGPLALPTSILVRALPGWEELF